MLDLLLLSLNNYLHKKSKNPSNFCLAIYLTKLTDYLIILKHKINKILITNLDWDIFSPGWCFGRASIVGDTDVKCFLFTAVCHKLIFAWTLETEEFPIKGLVVRVSEHSTNTILWTQPCIYNFAWYWLFIKINSYSSIIYSHL